MVCHFCPEAGKGGIGMREPSTVIKALGLAARAYGTERISPYFEASLFSPTDAWADEFHHQYREAGHNIKWRCESRVDVMTPKQVARLADAGLRVLDLGLESASIRQLTAMGKTREPCRYLRRASDLLKACADFGVWAKVNVMLYAGETPDTITETTDWLEAHRKCIKGISAGAVAVYGPSHVSGQFIAEIRRLGASIVNERSLEEVGYSGVHLSAELDEQAAIEVSRSISRSFMSASDYFDLKSFSYFPRHYSFADFEADVRNSDSSQLPFVSGT